MPKRKASDKSTRPNFTYDETRLGDVPSKLSRDPNKRVNDLNAQPVPDFSKQYINDNDLIYHSGDQRLVITLKASSDVTKDERESCYALIESTCRMHYEASSWGWHPKRKKREMREEEMRYLLVRFDGDETARIHAFVTFMLTHDSTPSVPVLYVYEIHLAEQLRQLRLGIHLMQVAEGIAERVGMDKVMLTCFLSNEKACGFYRKHGYVQDACSPEDRMTRRKVIKADYAIMSKGVARRSGSKVASSGESGPSFSIHGLVQGANSIDDR